MKWLQVLLKYLFFVSLIVYQIGICNCCIEEERVALLEFKGFLLSNSEDNAKDVLPSWVDDKESECCDWERVTCNLPGHVSKLNLNSVIDIPQNDFDSEPLLLNASLFLPFNQLLSLDLSENGFSCCVENGGLIELSNLEVLILSYNRLNDTLLIQELTDFRNLKILDLSNNSFVGSIPNSIQTLSSLKALSLSYNLLNGSLPIPGLCELKNLQELDLSHNHLTGVLPPCLRSLTSLRLLDFSFNQFEGKISSSPIPSLVSLEYIDLSHNLFEDSFSFESIANHTNLKVVMLGSDNNKLEVATECSSWFPKFQLTVLMLPNCNLNKLPEFLSHMLNLRVLDLSHNNIAGTFPNWLLENNPNLDYLILRSNSFFGQFYLSPNFSSKIARMDISDNHFNGRLQENIGEILPNDFYLNMSQNAFEGTISSSICNGPNLKHLDLSGNNFSGEFPDKFAQNCSGLLFLSLSNNRLCGQMPNTNMSSLRFLDISKNHLSGTVPYWISQTQNSFSIDISDNHMAGEIAGLFSNTSFPSSVNMRDNAFKGKITCNIFSAQFLDLSHNFISGPLPSCEISYLNYLNLQGNKITGSIPTTLFNSSYLRILNLKNNFLSGEIPTFVVKNSDLRVLLLGENSLSGLIPAQLCQFNKMAMLDLSQNSFSGPIPYCLSNLSFGNIKAHDSSLSWSDDVSVMRLIGYDFESLLHRDIIHELRDHEFTEPVAVEFITKTIAYIFKGFILDWMSGLDLSCNYLTGEIPPELGKLSWICSLNLSHNQLAGSIPNNFSNLEQIESLDLSYNNLSGEIPSALISLHFLEFFSVAHNNLSGKTPEKGQFSTFDNSTYEGNPFLCGPPLEKSCGVVVEPPTLVSDLSEEKWYEIDPVAFTASFASTYAIFLLCLFAVLYINPYWRQRWFNFIENCTYACYYFIIDTFRKLSVKFSW
ncbi:receptor-like protein 15 isoform X1 [Jatropha curcas]|uniref:receptor-like protein 15 isoform X1 n=1 Tax=Jatropha curcas TaxID=180498 RepID=UPI0009D6973B|nr:receptor-like protein 15 isoform X1 [Jatropha curcas]